MIRVCVYIYIYICMYIYIYIYIQYIYIYIQTHTHLSLYVYIYIYVCVYVYLSLSLSISLSISLSLSIYIYIYMSTWFLKQAASPARTCRSPSCTRSAPRSLIVRVQCILVCNSISFTLGYVILCYSIVLFGIYIYIYICTHIHTYTDTYTYTCTLRSQVPRLIFIHIHQLFRIQYTLFHVDTVNIYWWWCINSCRSQVPQVAPTFGDIYIYIYIY